MLRTALRVGEGEHANEVVAVAGKSPIEDGVGSLVLAIGGQERALLVVQLQAGE